jgi:GT2 family glycosyltransferase
VTDSVGRGPRVTAVTVNWNRPQDTLECLESLRRQAGVEFKSVVVDNGSTDDSARIIAQAYPDVVLIETGANLGFARGFNTGIRNALQAGAEYVLLLNNDTIAAEDMVRQLVFCPFAPRAVTAPIIFRYGQPNLIWSAGGEINRITLEIDSHHVQMLSTESPPIIRDFLSGCGLLVHRDVFDSVGLFDEQFFMYYEDLDFCIRVRRHGYHLWLLPKAKLWHKVSASSGGAGSPNERFNMAKSSVIYFRKHGHGLQWLAIVPIRILSALRWTILLARARSWDSLRGYWSGLVAGLR